MARSTEESRTGFEQHEGEPILHELSLVSDRQVTLQITCVFCNRLIKALYSGSDESLKI